MNILLLGGSNAGMRDGWAAQFAAMASAHVVENRFLGAVGSLFGLMALLKRKREAGPLPDLVIFEYCLNDILLVDAGMLDTPLIVDALEAVVAFCAREGVALLFLCLKPRPAEKPRKAVARVEPHYRAAARRGGFPCLWLDDLIAGDLTPAHFQDENHLTAEASTQVADAVLSAVEAGAVVPQLAEAAETRFLYVEASEATTHGPCRLQHLSSKVFDGPFLEIARGGWSYWRGEGRLVGLMLRSTERSGVYSIRAGAQMYRKNPRSQMQEVVKNLMLLHYVTRVLRVDGEVEIAMPADEAALMSLPEDSTLLPAPAAAPFPEQTLDIHGLMFWRKRSFGERLRALLSRDG